jgi:hypothetical protein
MMRGPAGAFAAPIQSTPMVRAVATPAMATRGGRSALATAPPAAALTRIGRPKVAPPSRLTAA